MASGHGGARSGAGRKAGSVNKATKKHKATLSELARGHTETAVNTLVQAMTKADTWTARIAAAGHILDRAYGKPVPAVPDLDGEDEFAPVIDLRVRGAVANVRVTKPQ